MHPQPLLLELMLLVVARAQLWVHWPFVLLQLQVLVRVWERVLVRRIRGMVGSRAASGSGRDRGSRRRPGSSSEALLGAPCRRGELG